MNAQADMKMFPARTDPRATTLANEIEAVAEAHGGEVSLARLRDIGMSVGAKHWDTAIEILEDRHGAWFLISSGRLFLASNKERHARSPRCLR